MAGQLTNRPIAVGMEEILAKRFSVLDHGFIRVVDYMGNDEAIVQAARVSYGSGTTKVSADKALIDYLMRHRHTTPFEMCTIKLHIKLPIFVARQWIRHRTASVNEYSARYSILDREFFSPDESSISPTLDSGNIGILELLRSVQNKLQKVKSGGAGVTVESISSDVDKLLSMLSQCEVGDDVAYSPHENDVSLQSSINKQGRGSIADMETVARTIETLRNDANNCYAHYEEMLGSDVARELARINLPVSFYTQWYWKTDLHNLFNFLRLRADSHAQYEIRKYAEIMLNDIVAKWVPMAYDAFMNYSFNAQNISARGMELIKKRLHGGCTEKEASALGKRELRELLSVFGLKEEEIC